RSTGPSGSCRRCAGPLGWDDGFSGSRLGRPHTGSGPPAVGDRFSGRLCRRFVLLVSRGSGPGVREEQGGREFRGADIIAVDLRCPHGPSGSFPKGDGLVDAPGGRALGANDKIVLLKVLPALRRGERASRVLTLPGACLVGCAALAAVLIVGSAAQADELSDEGPGHPGVTYGALLKQVMPGMQKNADGGWDSGPVKHFRDLDGKRVQELELSFKSVTATTVREDGHKRLLLMTDENSGGSGFDAVLA